MAEMMVHGITELFVYLEKYKDSLSEDAEIADAEELIRYYKDNREGLLPYRSQGVELPEHPEGLEDGNHLAKILVKKSSGKLWE